MSVFKSGDRVRGCNYARNHSRFRPSPDGPEWYEGTYHGPINGGRWDTDIGIIVDDGGTRRPVFINTLEHSSQPTPFEARVRSYIDKELSRG